MRQTWRTGLVGAVLIFGGAANAQTPTIPDPPPLRTAASFTNVQRHYAFTGCASGPVDHSGPLGTPAVTGTPYCVKGIYTIGVAPSYLNSFQPALFGAYDMAIQRDARVLSAFLQSPTNVWIDGTLTNAACPTGCAARSVLAVAPIGMIAPLVFHSYFDSLSPISLDANSVFTPERLSTFITYDYRGGDPFTGHTVSTRLVSFDLIPTTVPEPSTYTLTTTGLLGLAGMARRTRKA